MRTIHDVFEELEDVPGTHVFTGRRARQGYHLNHFCMSLMKADNRDRWHADAAAYLADWELTDEQRQALLARDYGRLLELGGNIYFLAKIMSTDGVSVAQGVSTMTDMSFAEYQAMMIAGGRSPEGVRSKRDAAATAAVAEAAAEIPHPQGDQ